MIALPSCDDLFLKFFDPWYDDAGRKRRPFKGTYPDIMPRPPIVGLLQAHASLAPAVQEKILEAISWMVEAARKDMKTYLPVEGDIDLSWIEAYDRAANRENVREILEKANPADFSNGYLINACEFGAAVSHVLRTLQPRLQWWPSWPYWDSCLFDPKTGSYIPVMHWGIKKMSEYGIDDSYAGKVKACLKFLDGDVQVRQ